jgi:uncharacterized protein (TIGR02246 family)
MRAHKWTVLLGAAAMALTVAGCERYGHHDGDHHGKADVGAVKAAIAADEKTWNDQFKSKNLDGLVGHYASDSYFVVPGMKAASGSADIRKAYEGALKDPNFAVSFSSDKVEVAKSGDLAYSRGHFTEKYTDPKTKQVVSDGGSYITVYKKQADGSWKAVEDFAAAEPAQ